MSRLPEVGSDNGTWGVILNDFLTQSHSDDGMLKPGSVGASQLQVDAVTRTAIGNGEVTGAKIADGAITAAKLAGDVADLLEGAGADGASAYEIAVAHGFVGSEAEWVASLRGESGEFLGTSDEIDEGSEHLFVTAAQRSQLVSLQADLDAKADSSTLGTAALEDVSQFATAAQGAKADSAVAASTLGAPGGVAPLDEAALIPDAHLPDRLSVGALAAQAGRWTALGSLMTPFTAVHPSVSVTHVADVSAVFPNPQSVVWSDSRLRHFAGTPEEVSPIYGCRLLSTGANNPQSLYVGFHVTGTAFALHLTVWATTDVTIYVDGLAATMHPYLVTGVGYQFVIVDGLDEGAHDVQCVIGWGSNFVQLVCAPDASVTAAAPPGFRFGLVGDSFTDSGIAPYYGGLARELHRLTGWAPAQLGQGSTGYTNDATSEGPGTGKSIYGSPSRLSALNALDPDVVIVVGSVNDSAASPATVRQAASDYYAALSPRQVIVVGVEPLYHVGDPGYAAWDAINAAVLDAAEDAENVIGVIDWRGEDWLTGTGSVSAPAGDGNQDLFIGDPAGTDTIHANYWGQRYLADRIARVIRGMKVAL